MSAFPQYGAATPPDDLEANARRFARVPPPIGQQSARESMPASPPVSMRNAAFDIGQIPGYDRPVPAPLGATNGQIQRPDRGTAFPPEKAMAWMGGTQPSDQESRDLGRRVPDSLRSSGGAVSARPLSYAESLKKGLPDTSAVVTGTQDDVRNALAEGRYVSAVFKGLRGSTALPVAVLNDTVGAATRSLSDPLEDAGRALLGMSDRPAAPTPPPSTPDSPTPVTPNPTDQRLADGAAKSPGTPTLANITRVGNSYSGAPNIAGDITVNGATPGGGGVSAQNMAAADALAGQQSLRGAGAVAPGTGRPVLQPAPNSDNSWQARNNLRNLEVSASSITNQKRWGGEGGRSADILAYQQALAADIGLRGGMDPGSVARTNATAAMYGDDQRADATRYTSDNSLRGQLASSNATRAATVAKMRYDMMKDGLEQSNKDRDYAASRNDAANKRQEETLKSLAAGPDGKIDEAKLASLRAQSTAFLGSAIEAARKRGDNATAAKLEAEGPSALGPAEQRRYQAAQKLDEIARQSNGLAPWKGNYRATDNPGARQVADIDKGILWDMAVMSDGTRVPANSLRYANGGALSGMNPYRVPTTEFESIDPKGLLRRP